MIPCSQSEPDLIDLLQATARYLWKDWPKDMDVSSVGERGLTLSGTCPHCYKAAAFPSVATFNEMRNEFSLSGGDRRIAVLRCIACNKYILGTIRFNFGRDTTWWSYENHYPVGTPNDKVAEEIPEHIGSDFKEAKRCLYVKAYSASAEMCRRAVETSCLDLGAPYNDVLENMIDWLEETRIITPALKNVAHKVRLGGNRGAHPWKIGRPVKPPIPVIVIEKEHAEAIVKFTWHFLEHVYVVPKQLPEFDFSKPKSEKKNLS